MALDLSVFQLYATDVVWTFAEALVLLLAGIIAGKILGRIVETTLKKIKFRETLESLKMEPTFIGLDIVGLAKLFVQWYTYLFFILAAFQLLDIPALELFIQEIQAFLPPIIEAILIAYIGIQVAGYVKSGLVKATMPQKKLIATITYYFMIYLTMVLSLTAIYPSGAELLNYLFMVLIASAGFGLSLGMGIAVGLGTKDIVAGSVKKYVKAK
ncbi:MAG: hypothetical protein GOU99_00970 [Candidatus Altiarchaeota archaeon]|nr:hypothetical protein [Candidatus Altiarchaeota archaeon]